MNQKQINYLMAIDAVQNDDRFLVIETGRFDDWVLCNDVYEYRKENGSSEPLEIFEMRELNSGYIVTQQTGRWNHCRDIVRLTKKGRAVVDKVKEAKV